MFRYVVRLNVSYLKIKTIKRITFDNLFKLKAGMSFNHSSSWSGEAAAFDMTSSSVCQHIWARSWIRS
jgi:hypothetical protein